MKMIRPLKIHFLVVCLAFFCIAVISLVHGVDRIDQSVTSVVIIGGTGDLAKKYLWQSFFNLYTEHKSEHSFNFIGAARLPMAEGVTQVSDILRHSVSCGKAPQPNSEDCPTTLERYRSMVTYRQLKTADDYASLCAEMEPPGRGENGRLFYLAVPPFAYAGIASNIAKGCRPGNNNGWLRVVFEKPFGHDTPSAEQLANQLSANLGEEEMYRIDHYLGKIGVQSILPFRLLNQEVYSKLWNRHHISRVEIVMKETDDTKGRLGFYDEYGVIRDVMQNHLTEIFALVAMELPANLTSLGEFRDAKVRLLNQTTPVGPRQAVIGQYADYVDQWRSELGKSEDETSLVPTFAAALLHVENPRWKGIPFVLVAGKKLDERVGYVRVVFKDDGVCVTAPSGGSFSRCGKRREVIFYTGNPGLRYPTVLVSRNLPEPSVPASWYVPDTRPDMQIMNSNLDGYRYFSPPADRDAYTSLVTACFRGDRQRFVGTGDLMASWRIWTPLLGGLAGRSPRVYAGGGDTGTLLDFRIAGESLVYVHELDRDSDWDVDERRTAFVSVGGEFRSYPLVTGATEDVIAQLARDITSRAERSIDRRGVFHIAFPGGSTPIPLFDRLAASHRFPWQHTHVWLVDERCVPAGHVRSNFGQLHAHLLRHVVAGVPYPNVHPMPVELASGLCAASDRGARIYERDLARFAGSRLDYVLLGVGADGHVASLFPDHATLREENAEVVLTDGGPADGVANRMTLSYIAINRARHVGMLVHGRTKRHIVSALKVGEVPDGLGYPALGVRPKDGELRWYIDHNALIGD